MKNKQWIGLFAVLFFALIYQSTVVFGDTVYFDLDGNVVSKAQYEQTAAEKAKYLGAKLRNGYGVSSKDLKDPIKLRAQRIEQWKMMRSHYDPDSLPHKIEPPATKDK
jgi:hypothetical protein